ncbi:hypothetical protein BCV72DRAFT_337371 [Rhizopus microsporus var. microsporus]|uniref:Cas12f1-like TNB domain-containing protein n=1 Tax=Rhizopus microsporus var. microsporus TaxID=86635 RepID=A0A1X0QWZ6_RHIZD|nr:hypothetical protein BCV72DRAFT_337371 [Rhizopus microsporus var. microsporus]
MTESTKLHFRNYRKKQKALNEMFKHLFSGSHKYGSGDSFEIHQRNSEKYKPLLPSNSQDERTRPVVLAFGAVRFGVLRGNVSAPRKLFRAAFLHDVKQPKSTLQRHDLHDPKYVMMIDEYLTSQICPRCQIRTTTNQPDAYELKIQAALNCQTCNTRWNCDHMASVIIRSIFLHTRSNRP